MPLIGETFNLIFFGPVVNLLVFIYRSLTSLHISGAIGFSIIALTILIRLLIWPFMASQLKSAKKMAELKPHLDKLKEKHSGDKQALSAAQMQLYKEHGINPAAGCLPTLIQFPVLIALYQTIFAFFNGSNLDRINNVLYDPSWKFQTPPDLHFLGLNLANKPADFNHVGIFLLAIPVVTALAQLAQSKMMTPSAIKGYPTDSPKEKKEKEDVSESMAAVQSQMMYMMPLMVGYFAFQFPIALALYWNTLTILGIVQQYLIGGWGGLADWLKFLKKS